MKRRPPKKSAEVLWAREDGALRQVTATAAGLTLVLVCALDGHPAGVLDHVQRLLRRRFRTAAVTLGEYHVAGTVLTAHWQISGAPPSTAAWAGLARQLARITTPWGERVRRGLERRLGHAAAAV